MTKFTRFKNLIIALIMIAFAAILLSQPKYGPLLIVLVTGIGMILSGVHSLVFYCTMAVHMVGGKKTFYRSILTMDLGVFLLVCYNASEQLILLYLMGITAVSGGIDLIRALEFKKEGAPWKHRLISGLISIGIMVAGMIFMDNPVTMVYIFSLWLFYGAASRIVSVFRKTAVIYIPE